MFLPSFIPFINPSVISNGTSLLKCVFQMSEEAFPPQSCWLCLDWEAVTQTRPASSDFPYIWRRQSPQLCLSQIFPGDVGRDYISATGALEGIDVRLLTQLELD